MGFRSREHGAIIVNADQLVNYCTCDLDLEDTEAVVAAFITLRKQLLYRLYSIQTAVISKLCRFIRNVRWNVQRSLLIVSAPKLFLVFALEYIKAI